MRLATLRSSSQVVLTPEFLGVMKKGKKGGEEEGEEVLEVRGEGGGGRRRRCSMMIYPNFSIKSDHGDSRFK